MPFLRSQNREKKSEPVMKEAPVRSLAPITFRITADVKPKPIVAEIKVGFMNNDKVTEIIYVPPSGTGIKYHNVNIGLHRTSGGEEVSLPIPSCQGDDTTMIFLNKNNFLSQAGSTSTTCSSAGAPGHHHQRRRGRECGRIFFIITSSLPRCRCRRGFRLEHSHDPLHSARES